MWQRFTERSRRIVFFAQEEAGRLGENYVSTEHLLLGLCREHDSVAARILDRMKVPPARVRSEIERQVAHGDGHLGQDMQLTPRAKRVIDLAYDEARRFNNNYIGTEHLLLGLIREEEGLAGRVLSKLGVDLERTRREVMQLQYEKQNKEEKDEDAAVDTKNEPPARPLLERLQAVVNQMLALDPSLNELPAEQLLAALTGRAAAPDDTNHEPQIGDRGALRNADDQRVQVELALDAAAFLDLVAVFRARDAHGYRDLVAGEQRVALLPSDTYVKLLQPPHSSSSGGGRSDVTEAATRAGGYFVRVLSGDHDHEGMAGWVEAARFARVGPDNAPFPPVSNDDSAFLAP